MAHGALSGPVELKGSSEQHSCDDRLIFVQNIDVGATIVEVEDFFSSCGPIRKVAITRGRFHGRHESFALIEFADAASTKKALAKSGSTFRGQCLLISAELSKFPLHPY